MRIKHLPIIRAGTNEREDTTLVKTLDCLLNILQEEADSLVTIDMRQAVTYTDYFLICNSRHRRHAEQILGKLKELLHANGISYRVERDINHEWILLDCDSVVVHIFSPHMRRYYRLENLWGMCPQQKIFPQLAKI